MSKESSLEKTAIECVTIFLIVLVVSLCVKFHMDNRVAFENGYERAQRFGTEGDRWAKIKS